MRPIFVVLSVTGMFLPLSCLDDNDRCGKFDWDPDARSCTAPLVSTDSNSIEKDAGIVDGGIDSEDSPPPPILGEPCQSDADCAVYNADYCNLAATDPFCSLKDCMELPDGCPTGFSCCVSPSPEWFLDHCMPSDIYEEIKEMLCVI